MSVCCELTWVKYLFDDLKMCNLEATDLYWDDKVTIHIAANLIFHEMTRHIKTDCHLVIDEVQEGSIVTRYVNNKQ